MGDESSQTRAAALLREYLATRDIPCEGCGYNLRGAQDVFCPECGAVIPRPPAEYVTRIRADPAHLKLWCTECGYSVTGANVERCPECGAAAMERYSGDRPPKARRRRLRKLPPIPLLINAVLGLCVAFPCLGLAMGRWSGNPSRVGGGADPYIGAAAAFAAVGIAVLWFWYRKPLAALGHGERRALILAAFVVGVGLIVVGMRALR